MRCRIFIVISISVMTCRRALVLVRRHGVETQALVCITVAINMGLDKDSRALLVKLFYQNNNNSAAALHEYRCINDYGEVLQQFLAQLDVSLSQEQFPNRQ